MNIQVATLCDAATNHNERLCVLGAFDTIRVCHLPAVHPFCSFAMRLCFAAGDEGRHQFSIRIVDDDGINILAEPIASEIDIELPGEAMFMTRSLVLNFLELRFERAGNYSIDLVVDDQMLTRIPLRVDGAEKIESGRSWGTSAA